MKKHLVLAFLVVIVFNLRGQGLAKMQSAYIYHFTKYMQWPSAKQSGDFVIAVVGSSEIYEHLQNMAAIKKAGVQNIIIKKFGSVAAVSDCHMIFLSASKSYQLGSAIGKGKQFHALIVTEKNGYGKRGAGINFVIIEGKPKFEVNESSINQNGIKVSAKFVQLGIKV
jgi:hypothetical protein